MPAYDVHNKTAELLGPAPCDRCRHARRCGRSGEACLAFSEYVRGASEGKWRLMPTQPRADIASRLGFEPRQVETLAAGDAIDTSIAAAQRRLFRATTRDDAQQPT